MKKDIREELPKYKREITIGVITSLLSTLILKAFPEIAAPIYSGFLNILDKFTTAYSTDIFQTISFGNTINYVN